MVASPGAEDAVLQHPGGLRGLLRAAGVDVGRAIKVSTEAATGMAGGTGQGGLLSCGGADEDVNEEGLLSLSFPLTTYEVVEGQLRKYRRNLLKKDGIVPIRTLLSVRCVTECCERKCFCGSHK